MFETILKALLGSKGVKRLLASLIGVVMTVVQFVPEAQGLLDVLQYLAGLVGGVGVVHATGLGTLGKAKLASLASLCSVLLLASHFIPALAPAAPWLTKLVSLFSALAVGNALGRSAGINEVRKAMGLQQ